MSIPSTAPLRDWLGSGDLALGVTTPGEPLPGPLADQGQRWCPKPPFIASCGRKPQGLVDSKSIETLERERAQGWALPSVAALLGEGLGATNRWDPLGHGVRGWGTYGAGPLQDGCADGA